MEDSLSKWGSVESVDELIMVSEREVENRAMPVRKPASKNWRTRNIMTLFLYTKVGQNVKEMPIRCSINHHVVYRTTNENPIY